MPGIAGWQAALEHLADIGIANVHAREQQLTTTMWDQLAEIPNVELFGPPSPQQRLGIVSLRIAGLDPRELAAILDASYGIQARAGIHCAPRLHRTLGTTPEGTLRFSVGWQTTAEEIAAAVAAIREIAGEVA
jgi:selenocysteine lyase/cysteine desulfurase